MNLTLDGFMSGPDHELDWHFPLWNEEMSRFANAQLMSMDTILLGRLTYQSMVAYWPTAPLDDYSFRMNAYKKIVISSTLQHAAWTNTEIFAQGIEEKILALKNSPGKDIIIYGSRSIVTLLSLRGLIDEYRIWVHPVAIGKGIPLLNQTCHRIHLKLFNTRSFSTGVVLLYYMLDHQQSFRAMVGSDSKTNSC